MALLISFIVAMVLTMALIPLVMRWADRLRIVDVPGGRRAHTAPVPKVGGIAMVAGTLVSAALWLPTGQPIYHAYFVAALIILVFGVCDDRTELRPSVKIFGQLLAIAVVIIWGGVSIDTITLTDAHVLPRWIAVPVTVIFILGVTNAINLSDGLDGLAGGTTLLTAAVLVILSRSTGNPSAAIAAAATGGAILGFLRYNTYPARVFMGDGGSQFLGFTVAVLAIILTQESGASLSTALPLLLLGLPAMDTMMVMAQRAREKQPLFQGDRRHIHHKLLDLGFDHYEAVLLIYVGHTAFLVAAWLLRYQSDVNVLLAFSLLAATIVSALLMAGRLGWRWRRPIGPSIRGRSALGRGVLWLAQSTRLPRWSLGAAACGVVAYLLIVAAQSEPTSDIGWLAIGLVVPAAVICTRIGDRAPWIARLLLSIAAAMAVYLDHEVPDLSILLHFLKLASLALIAFGVLLRMRLSTHRFEITTLDVLLVLVAVIVPNLPGLTGPGNLGFSILKLVVMFYAMELCIDQGTRARVVVGVGALLFALVVALLTFVIAPSGGGAVA